MRNLITLLAFLTSTAAFAVIPEKHPTDQFQIGKASTSNDKQFLFDLGLGASNPSLGVDISNVLKFNYNIFSIGDATNGTDKKLTADIGNGSTNPKIIWNHSLNSWQFTNDGSTFSNVGGAPPSSSIEVYSLGLAASVGSNNLTVALKQADGSSNPSVANPVKLTFRNTTATSGAFSEVSITSGLNILASSGASFGLTNGQNSYIYVYLQYNAGTPELALSGSRIYDEGSLQTTTTISAGATSNQVLYASTGRSNQPIRFIGRILVNEATAGVYASSPTEVTVNPTDRKLEAKSRVSVSNGNGHGSTNTFIRRFSTVNENVGANISYSDSATLGASFVINSPGVYIVNYTDGKAASDNYFGVSLNTSAPTSSINGLTYAQGFRGAAISTNATGGQQPNLSVTLICVPGDVIRPHTDSGPSNTAMISSNFTVTQID